jgi:hypothetical protein
MMPGLPRLSTFLTLLLLSACAALSPRQPETYYFDCDVPEGRFSEWNRTVKGREVQVSGTLELIEPRRDPGWSPVANVYISGKDQSYAGLRLVVDQDSQGLARVLLVTSTGPTGEVLISHPWQGESIPWSLTLTPSGELSARALDSTRSVHVRPFEPESVHLGCSTGQFKYRDVSVDVPR